MRIIIPNETLESSALLSDGERSASKLGIICNDIIRFFKNTCSFLFQSGRIISRERYWQLFGGLCQYAEEEGGIIRIIVAGDRRRSFMVIFDSDSVAIRTYFDKRVIPR